MKHQELIERYIYAVTHFMKKSEGEDVAKELASIIDDMLMERCAGEEPDEDTVKDILRELGDPRDLYEKYSSDGKDSLIGAPYYGVYKSVMKTVLACVTAGLIIAQIIVCIMNASSIATVTDITSLLITIIQETCATVFEGIVFAFAAVTLWFAIMYHRGIKPNALFVSPEQLPQLPGKDAGISKTSVAFGMGISILFFTLFLICPQVLCTYNANTEMLVPIFDTDYIHGTRYLIITFAALGIGRECVKLLDGAYTKRLLIVTAIVDGASAVLSASWLWNPRILNDGFVTVMEELFADTTPFVCNMMVNFNYFFLGCIWLALALDFGVVAWRYWRGRK